MLTIVVHRSLSPLFAYPADFRAKPYIEGGVLLSRLLRWLGAVSYAVVNSLAQYNSSSYP